jgi:hypothetical protein
MAEVCPTGRPGMHTSPRVRAAPGPADDASGSTDAAIYQYDTSDR